MGIQQITAPPCARPASSGGFTPPSGVIHVNFRHTAGFTVVGNHLSQHRELSLVAIGLALHIQSLPAGAKIGIKRLAERFPESETRIAAALRELEATGYLHRSRLRLADGRIVTRTVLYNQPGAGRAAPSAPRSRTRPGEPAAPRPAPSPPREATRAPEAPQPQAAPVCVPTPTARTTPPPPLPRPAAPTPELQRTAAALLADLRRLSPRLVLSEQEVGVLTPGVVTWLERAAHPDSVRHALTADLPVPLKHPAKLLRHRITALLPPPLPGAHDLAPPPRPGAIVIPLQNCDRCDRAFRSRHPGHCRDCRAEAHAAA
ncbi:MAG TPA: helix-turn-helix domain-containing protein [Streptomyces sp.]|uniref:helix-turn-helix domain-containing protein n=1 Tax=Streptomyces sp. TaxID=1931 RepID=UPI002CBF5C24|nr:helix-turn-helix domain-containing protein [Streptomyces sp.]HWU09505.1 helix-turn-helix domain-containing protein [Streptomyces sp.]